MIRTNIEKNIRKNRLAAEGTVDTELPLREACCLVCETLDTVLDVLIEMGVKSEVHPKSSSEQDFVVITGEDLHLIVFKMGDAAYWSKYEA